MARLIDLGTAFRHGALASLPTVTLANHTSLLTGCHPGHHGVLHNAWYDRAFGRQVVTESPATWQEAMTWLAPGVETVHQALKRRRPDAVTVSVNEPADSGADYSTFELFRQGRADELLPDLCVLPAPTTTDSPRQRGLPVVVLRRRGGPGPGHRPSGGAPPGGRPTRHRCSPGSASPNRYRLPRRWSPSEVAGAAITDTDARVGVLMAAVEGGRGLRPDGVLPGGRPRHGGERPPVEGDWGDALRAAGITFRDEASGFLYLDVAP